ncbi:hypothetical protein ERJ75_001846100 [Trypanosoma vivax]|nr:hypothetical protein ERJ75_001846100 [Trypanosoma vivax]
MCYGVASWWFDTSLSDRERLERVQAQAAHILAGNPKAANWEDALREARLKPTNEVAHRRALEHCLQLKAKGPVHAKVADSIFPPEHPIHVRLAKAQHLCRTINGMGQTARREGVAADQARSLQHHHAGRTQSGRAREVQEGTHHAARERFRDFDYRVWTDGSVVLDVSSGAGALVCPIEGR